MDAISASQSRAADSTSVLSTALRSKVDRLMTLSTSAVAVCCWSDSRSSVSSRVFSMAMTAWAAKFCTNSICLSVNVPDLLAKDANLASQVIALAHRHGHDRPIVAQFDRGPPLRIVCMRRYVVDLNHLLRGGNPPESSIRWWSEKQLAFACIGIGGRRIVQGDRAKCITFAQPKRAEFGLTYKHRILKHGLKHQLQFTRRAADDLKHVGSGGLLLQGFAQLVQQPSVLDGDDGLGGKIGD